MSVLYWLVPEPDIKLEKFVDAGEEQTTPVEL
jgi:hypothetical protein